MRNERLLGPLTARRRLVTDPMRRAGVRDYHPDDPFRTINWKATARTGSLKVNVNDPVISTVMMVVLNLDTFTHYWEGLAVEQSERAIEIAASIARWGIEQQISVGHLHQRADRRVRYALADSTRDAERTIRRRS